MTKAKSSDRRATSISGEVPKLAEGTPLERVQVVKSGARVQIPPSPLHRSDIDALSTLITEQ